MIPVHILQPLERFRDGLNVVVQDGADAASVQVVWAPAGHADKGVIVLATRRGDTVEYDQMDYQSLLAEGRR